MEKNNFYQNKNIGWGPEHTLAAVNAIGTIGNTFVGGLNQPGYQPPAPTYNVYQMPGSGGGSSAPAPGSESKKEASKIMGMDSYVFVILLIIIIAAIGGGLYYVKNQ